MNILNKFNDLMSYIPVELEQESFNAKVEDFRNELEKLLDKIDDLKEYERICLKNN